MGAGDDQARAERTSESDELGQRSGDQLRLPAEESFGRYRLLARIGRGGMADVYLGLSPGARGLTKPVVVKRIKAGTEETSLNQMFLDEARIAARLSHPNVVHTYEVGEFQNDLFIVMELLAGQPLRGITKFFWDRGVKIPAGFAAYVVREALVGLHYAHQLEDYDGTPLEIVHRDVSPQNIFVTYEGLVKVVDFGIAKSRGSAETEDGVLKGKVAYMSPEQALGATVDRRTDVFATGIVMWELLTGRRLFAETNAAQVLVRLVNEAIPPPSAVLPSVEPALDAIVRRALTRSPDARYPSAEAMAKDVSAYLAEHPYSATEASALLAEYFATPREEMRALMQECMRRPGSLASAQVRKLSADLFPDAGERVIHVPSVGPGTSRTQRSPTRTGLRRRKSDRVLAWAVPVAIVVGLGVILLLWRPAQKVDAPALASAPLPPAPVLSAPVAPPSAPTPPEPAVAPSAEPAPPPSKHAIAPLPPERRAAPLAAARAPAPKPSAAPSAPLPAEPSPAASQRAGRRSRTIDSDFPGQ